MVHSLTRKAVSATLQALNAPMELGFVFPPQDGEVRGRGSWSGRGLSALEMEGLLPRAAAANARGAAIYMRVYSAAADMHPGLVLLDDLTAEAVARLGPEGFAPRLVVETSPSNFQSWIALVPNGHVIDHETALAASRMLASQFAADPRAVSSRQPGRVPGYTNRKPKHRRYDGLYPFTKLISASPSIIAEAGPALIRQIAERADAQRRRRGPPENQEMAGDRPKKAGYHSGLFDDLLQRARAKIALELQNGQRSAARASQSEIDFMAVREALRKGCSELDVATWLKATRSDKQEAYAERTVAAAASVEDLSPRRDY